jgi:hypothetical protein
MARISGANSMCSGVWSTITLAPGVFSITRSNTCEQIVRQ